LITTSCSLTDRKAVPRSRAGPLPSLLWLVAVEVFAATLVVPWGSLQEKADNAIHKTLQKLRVPIFMA
jgi:hypothetical protein